MPDEFFKKVTKIENLLKLAKKIRKESCLEVGLPKLQEGWSKIYLEIFQKKRKF